MDLEPGNLTPERNPVQGENLIKSRAIHESQKKVFNNTPNPLVRLYNQFISITNETKITEEDAMIRTVSKIALSALIAVGLMIPATAEKAEAKSKKKIGIFTRMERKVKRTCKRVAKKTKRAIGNTVAKAQNGVVDSAMKAKSAVTGKKNKSTWVQGSYKKGQKSLTNGHFRKVNRSHKPSAPAPAPAPAPADPAPAPAPGM